MKLFVIIVLTFIFIQSITCFSSRNNNTDVKQELSCDDSLLFDENLNGVKILKFSGCDFYKILTHDNLPGFIDKSDWIFLIKFENSTRSSNLTDEEKKEIKLNLDRMEREIFIEIMESKNFEYFSSKFSFTESVFKNPNATIDSLEFLLKLKCNVANLTFEEFFFETNQMSIINSAIKNNCALCLRLAHWCDPRYLEYLKIFKSTLEESTCDINYFRAIINLPYHFNFTREKVSNEIYTFLHEKFIAHLDCQKTLILKNSTNEKMCNISFHALEHYEKLADLAAIRKQDDVLEFFIRADFPFPLNLNFERNSSIEHLFNDLVKFHYDINSGNLKSVEKFLIEHKILRFARFPQQSALMTAWKSNNYEMFSFLQSKGMLFANVYENEIFFKQLLNKTSRQRYKFSNYKQKFTKKLSANPVELLVDRTRINYAPQKFNESYLTNVIREAYTQLYKVIPDIVDVVCYVKDFTIFFDFTDDKTNNLEENFTHLYLGNTICEYNQIFIGARNLLNSNSFSRLQTIAHEMTHFVMCQIYQNNANPYDVRDTKNETKMNEIAAECKTLGSFETIIGQAFKTYNDTDAHSELIARVVSLHLVYHDNITLLNTMKSIYKSLFDYYETKVLTDIRTRPLSWIKINQLNQWFDAIPSTSHNSTEQTLNSSISLLIFDRRFNITCTNNITGALTNILKDFDEQPLIIKSSFSNNKSFYEIMVQANVIESGLSSTLIVICDDKQALMNFYYLLQYTTFKSVIVLVDDLQAELLKCKHYIY